MASSASQEATSLISQFILLQLVIKSKLNCLTFTPKFVAAVILPFSIPLFYFQVAAFTTTKPEPGSRPLSADRNSRSSQSELNKRPQSAGPAYDPFEDVYNRTNTVNNNPSNQSSSTASLDVPLPRTLIFSSTEDLTHIYEDDRETEMEMHPNVPTPSPTPSYNDESEYRIFFILEEQVRGCYN